MDDLPDHDPRVRRTRAAIRQAFVGLLFGQRYDTIRTGDLIAAAGVGRATFYEHYRGKDDVLLATMAPILIALAGAATGRANRRQVRSMLDHVWTQRATARTVLGSAAAAPVERRLAAMIAARLDEADDVPPRTIRATAAAAAQLAVLRAWVAGAAACSAETLADQLLASTQYCAVRPPTVSA